MRPLPTLLVLFAFGLNGCVELDEFPSESIVTGPRILAVVADPPEVTIGSTPSFSVLVAGADEVEVSYGVCARFDGPFGGAQFGEREEEDCTGGELLSGDGSPSGTWEVPPEAIAAFLANRELIETALGGALSPEAIESVLSSVGYPLLVDVNVRADGRELRAVKRVLLSPNSEGHSNPPRPRFALEGVAVRPDPDTDWGCTSDEPLRVRAGEPVELAPEVVDGEEPWLERYTVINARGEVEERTERAFYSWYATGGDFESDVTRAPLRNQIWTAPPEPGRHRLWLVVRDGHGGTSACGVDVTVTPR